MPTFIEQMWQFIYIYMKVYFVTLKESKEFGIGGISFKTTLCMFAQTARPVAQRTANINNIVHSVSSFIVWTWYMYV